MSLRRIGATLAACLSLLAGCAASKVPAAPPCFTVNNDSELRATDAAKTVSELSRHIHLSPQDEALLRDPARRSHLMNAVGDSIDDYFAQATRLASR